MEKQTPVNEKKENPSEEEEPLIPCELCGSLVFERHAEMHSSKICRKKNPRVIGYERKHEGVQHVEHHEEDDEEDDEDEDEEGEEEEFSKKELQFILANFRRKISWCIQRNVDVVTIVRYIVRYGIMFY
jgi:hypothetical protein